MGGVCCACMHSFFIDCQSLRELRITSVLRNAAIQGRNVGRIKCNGPVNFFPERRYFKQHMRFPAQPPPHHQASLLSLATPPPSLKSSVVLGAGSSPALGTPTGAFSLKKGDPSDMTAATGICEGSEP